MLEPVFDWEAFKDETKKITVHCKTEEEAKDFCKQMHEHGMKWCSGKSYLNYTNWKYCKEEACYSSDGIFGDYDWYKKEKYTILEWSDYMNTEKEQKLFIPKKCRRVLKQLRKDYKWIAKDEDGTVYVYKYKPSKKEKSWLNFESDCKNLTEIFADSLFDWLSWNDEKPVNFREILKGRKERYDR